MYSPGLFAEFADDNSVGRRTFFWYRVYCGCMAGLYGFLIILGLLIVSEAVSSNDRSAQETFFIGVAYAIAGAVFGLLYLIALLLPRKPYNWVVGIVLIAFGLTGCCFLPATVPLLIFWLKPETKAYLGRMG